MKSFALATLAAVSQATLMTEMDYSFMKFITKFSKFYETVEEFNLRKDQFVASVQTIAELNSGNGSYKAGLNHFSDWTEEEYNTMLGLKNVLQERQDSLVKFTIEEGENVAPVDWRDAAGVVTPVKDQGACGSCWAFSATEAVESAYVIAGNEQVIMAPQELVDCSKGIFSNHGCNGGRYYDAW